MPSPRSDALRAALAATSSSDRLQAALTAGTHPDPDYIETLVQQCAIETDFFVRDMLTWALIRHPRELTVPRVLEELQATGQARSQALHTLSKIGDPAAWPAITTAMLHDSDVEVARAAWRAAVILSPHDEKPALALELAKELGRGDRSTQLSLSRALIDLGDTVPLVLNAAALSDDPLVREHARATEVMWNDAESD